MCGIVGVWSFGDPRFKVDEGLVARLRDRMSHRGPDGVGTWVDRENLVGLGHRRLAIVDLSPMAAQPMTNEDGTLRIVFNGEIYNHAEVRRELEATGRHTWRTDHSDTEVILHAYEEWGTACLEKFRGMFAFALWDGRKRELWLARDRLGIKPLYWTIHHGRIVFASEIKAILEDDGVERAVDEDSLFHYLSFLATPAPRTLFRGIQKLPPGTWLRIKADGSTESFRYWDVWDHTKPLRGIGEEELARLVREELRTAVRLHKESDVPVGVFLSGGIDSSTNAALFSEGERSPVRCFTIGYAGEFQSYKNEVEYARSMAERLGAEHHVRLLTQNDLLDFLPRMVELQDEPIADPVCVPVYYVSQLARDHGVTVCQVGEGADELFCGYPWWKQALDLEKKSRWAPRWMKRLYLARLRRRGQDSSHRYEYLRRSAAGQPVFWSGADIFTDAQKKAVLSPRLRERFKDRTSWEAIEPIWRRYREKAWEQHPLNWMTYIDLNLRLPELLLMRVDKMGMGASLEGRVPFLDHRFVELAMSIPARAKTRGGVLKRILKRAVRGLIPDELIDRPKQGFGVPVQEWIREELGALARKELEAFCRETDFLDPEAVKRTIEQGSGIHLWALLNLALWHRTYIQPLAAGKADRVTLAAV